MRKNKKRFFLILVAMIFIIASVLIIKEKIVRINIILLKQKSKIVQITKKVKLLALQIMKKVLPK